jgi:gas vesicle protein
MAHERGSGGAAVFAFLGGAALGAFAALLLAPQTGRTTRAQLRGYAKKAQDTLREVADEAGQRFEEAVNEGKEYVEARKSVLREAFQAGREAMKQERDRPGGDS